MELQMNSASNLLVLGVTGQVGKLVAKHLKRSKTNFSVGSRRKENLKELADHIVHLGAFTRDHDAYATVFAWHQMIEAYLRDSGVAWTNLHPNMFMQNW